MIFGVQLFTPDAFRLCSVRSDIAHATPSLLSGFILNKTSGVITVGNIHLDYEQIDYYTLEIETIDSGISPLTFTGTVLVNVTDVNESPTNITLTNDQVNL